MAQTLTDGSTKAPSRVEMSVAPCRLGSDWALIDLVEDLVYIRSVDQVNVHDAKTHFSRLLDRVAKGEEVIIAKSGRPVAKLVPIRPTGHRRVPGLARGLIEIRPDFDEPLPEDIQRAFD